MTLDIDEKERELLAALVKSRISELHPEIRRSMDHTYKEKLQEELKSFESLLERLESKE